MANSEFHFNPDICVFGVTNFRNHRVRFGIKTDDRRRHMYIIGKTGMGKSTMMENMFLQDMWNGHGCCYIDPHGDTVEKFLKVVPNHRINDVIYFNPSDVEYPIAFNFFDKVEPHQRHMIASGVVGAFKKIWADSWGPRLEYVLRNAVISLLDYPDSTILGVMRILTDKEFRAKVIEKMSDPVVKNFWINEFAKLQDKAVAEVISPIQNKIGQFLSSSMMRNIVAQPHVAFNLREVMDQKKILLVNLSKGKLGEDNSAMLGAMMINKLQIAAMSRVDTTERERKDFFLYVDEFQNFSTDSFANILSEARKYRLNLTIGHQYIDQLDDKVRTAVFGNVGTISCFRVGSVDAAFLEQEFMPRFTKDDIINLPKWKAYLRLMIDGVASEAFSADLLPPIEVPEDTSVAEKVVKVTRERYCQPRALVEEKVERFSNATMEQADAVIRRSNKNNDDLPRGALAFDSAGSGVVMAGSSQKFAAPKEFRQQNGRLPVVEKKAPVFIAPMEPVAQPLTPAPVIETVEEKMEAFSVANSPEISPVPAPDDVVTVSELPSTVESVAPVVQVSDIVIPSEPVAPTVTKIPVPSFTTASISNPKQSTQQVKRTVSQAAPMSQNTSNKPLFSAVCASCGKETRIPFKPDGQRSVYCKDCLPKIRSMQAKGPVTPKPISLAAALGKGVFSSNDTNTDENA